MNEPDIRQVEQRLAAVISKERREVIGYTLLTVLCTPAFVVLASLAGMFILFYVFRYSDYHIGAIGIYTGVNIFLAYMLMFVLMRSNPPEDPNEFDNTWLAGVVVFLFLILLTYATSLRIRFPLFFGILYSLLGFLVMGLLGHVQINKPVTDDSSSENQFLSLLLAIAGFIAMAYGEIAHGSWLWIPPNPDEVRLAAWILCKLAVEIPAPFDSRLAPRHILNLLSRLKLVHMTEGKLKLTLKGADLVTMADRN